MTLERRPARPPLPAAAPGGAMEAWSAQCRDIPGYSRDSSGIPPGYTRDNTPGIPWGHPRGSAGTRQATAGMDTTGAVSVRISRWHRAVLGSRQAPGCWSPVSVGCCFSVPHRHIRPGPRSPAHPSWTTPKHPPFSNTIQSSVWRTQTRGISLTLGCISSKLL